ncbi:plasmid partition protein ParG [Desulfohalobium retbaense]|uniref:Plasmid segregation centromere-binding protein ParG n=1 Tax=Desulfohalobium retbaense (strain ATCC 49708 / DSM 5692 / JCM 16813 / HR100) TaxID=485915 RepID=C8X5T5_DESRD|nr:plasmid partition protein ParG [Desulfohalobium retbaense]ACV69782.1 conserved hypothetical protein [Desulfohalobium retbaense DSM 5692]
MAKKVGLGPRPTRKAKSDQSQNAWVSGADQGAEAKKRLTIDISESLHRRIKADCASRGTKIADEVRALLAEKFEG